MANVNWKTVVDMEMHNFREDISELKAVVAKVGAIIIGFCEQMQCIAASVKVSKDEGERQERQQDFGDDFANHEPVPENQFRCPQHSADRLPSRTSADPSESDDVMRCLEV